MKMSKWDEVHTEPMHDHPAEKDQLVAAMEAAGYTLDTLESTGDNLRFYGAAGNIMTMGGWHECEEWLNGVVFDDPQVSDRVEIILHPERFPERDPQRAALRAVEDAVEQNDNNFDGVINNLPEPDPAEAVRQQARQSEQTAARDSVLEELKAQREKADLAEKAKRRPQLFRNPNERERV
jgi:ribosomal protein S20